MSDRTAAWIAACALTCPMVFVALIVLTPEASAVDIDPAPPIVVGSTVDRPTFPVVIDGERLPDLIGAPLGEIRAFRWDAAARGWSTAPFQVDERSAAGGYLVREDGLLDASDQVVGLARNLGGRAPACAWPDGIDTTERFDLRVTDPLSPTAEGWMTLLRAGGTAQQVPTLVRFDRQERELRGSDYRLVQAGTFVGLETLELFDSGIDVLDRTKLRGDVYVKVAPMIGPIPLPTIVVDESYTEESDEVQQYADGFVFNPVKQGPVRLVLEADGSGFAYPGQVQMLAAFGRVNIPPVPTQVVPFIDRLELSFRMSVDMSEQALIGRYSDSNVPEGVAVDGRHEKVPERPVTEWRQVDTPHGGLVMVAGRPQALRALANYYNDRGRDEPPGTGDNKAFGEFGVFTEDYDSLRRVADFLGWLVVVPPESPVVGERVTRQLQVPLEVEVVPVGRETCPPSGSPTVAASTPTATDHSPVTETPSATPTPTAASATSTEAATSTTRPSSLAVYMPVAHRRVCIPGKVPVDVVLIVDASSSMLAPVAPGGQTKLEAARAAAGQFARLFDPRHARLAVVSFAFEATDRTGGLTSDVPAILGALDAIATAPGTRIEAGLAMAGHLLAGSQGRETAAVLLSDGGGDMDASVAEVGRLRASGVRVFAIGFGSDADVDLLRALVADAGDYHAAATAEGLLGIYRAIGTEIICQP